MQLPLAVTRSGTERVTFKGLTRNISSNGVLFTAAHGTDLGGLIEYVITLNQDDSRAINLRCIGKVVRAERLDPAAPEGIPAYQIAATLERYEFVR